MILKLPEPVICQGKLITSTDSANLFLQAKSTAMLSPQKDRSMHNNIINPLKSLHYGRDMRYDVVPCKNKIYCSLQKILKSTTQNLQHGSIF